MVLARSLSRAGPTAPCGLFVCGTSGDLPGRIVRILGNETGPPQLEPVPRALDTARAPFRTSADAACLGGALPAVWRPDARHPCGIANHIAEIGAIAKSRATPGTVSRKHPARRKKGMTPSNKTSPYAWSISAARCAPLEPACAGGAASWPPAASHGGSRSDPPRDNRKRLYKIRFFVRFDNSERRGAKGVGEEERKKRLQGYTGTVQGATFNTV